MPEQAKKFGREYKPSPIKYLKEYFETEPGKELLDGLRAAMAKETSILNPNLSFDTIYLKADEDINVGTGYFSDFKPALLCLFNQTLFGGIIKGYGRGNWLKGLKYSTILDAVLRHIFKFFFLKSDKDKESGGPELSGALWGLAALITYIYLGKGTDDR